MAGWGGWWYKEDCAFVNLNSKPASMLWFGYVTKSVMKVRCD